MMLSALDAGLAVSDMRHMKYTHLVQVLWEHEDMCGAGDGADETRDATAEDYEWLKSL